MIPCPPSATRTDTPFPSTPLFRSFFFRLPRLLEPRQPCRRRGGVGADPAVVDILDRHCVEMVPPLAPAALGDDESGIFQHFQMLHHRAAIEFGEMRAQRAGGQRLILDRKSVV